MNAPARTGILAFRILTNAKKVEVRRLQRPVDAPAADGAA